MVNRHITITDSMGGFVFHIDFQETPQVYREKRLKHFMSKYPLSEGYKYTTLSLPNLTL